jgi:TRAP-type C4-dicarboxylate transport system permease small subunit
MDSVVKAVNRFGDWLGVIAGILLVAIMTLIVVNIVLRQVASPYGGTAEVVGYLTAMCAGFSLLYSQKKRAHIAIDIFTTKMAKRPRAALTAVMNLIAVAVFSMATWQIAARAMTMQKNGTLSDTLQIAYYPFIWVIAICFGLFTLRVLMDVVTGFRDAFSREVKA